VPAPPARHPRRGELYSDLTVGLGILWLVGTFLERGRGSRFGLFLAAGTVFGRSVWPPPAIQGIPGKKNLTRVGPPPPTAGPLPVITQGVTKVPAPPCHHTQGRTQTAYYSDLTVGLGILWLVGTFLERGRGSRFLAAGTVFGLSVWPPPQPSKESQEGKT